MMTPARARGRWSFRPSGAVSRSGVALHAQARLCGVSAVCVSLERHIGIGLASHWIASMWRQYIPENISLESIIEQAAAYVNESCRDERATAALLKAVPFAALCASLEGHAERRALRETDVDEDDADGCDDEETRILVRAIESVVQQALESAALSEQVPVSSLLDWVALGLHSRHTEVRLTAARMLRMPLEAAAATVDGKQAASSRVCEEVLNRFGAPPCSPSLTGSGTLGCVAMMSQCGARPSGIDRNGVGSTDTPEGDVLVPLLRVLRDDRSTEVASTAAACLLALVRARPNRGAYALLCDPRGRAILLEQMLDGEAGAIALVRAAQLVLCLAGVSEFAATAARQILQEVLQQRIERWDGVAAAAADDDILLRLNLLEALGEFVAQLPSGSELLDELGLFGMLREGEWGRPRRGRSPVAAVDWGDSAFLRHGGDGAAFALPRLDRSQSGGGARGADHRARRRHDRDRQQRWRTGLTAAAAAIVHRWGAPRDPVGKRGEHGGRAGHQRSRHGHPIHRHGHAASGAAFMRVRPEHFGAGSGAARPASFPIVRSAVLGGRCDPLVRQLRRGCRRAAAAGAGCAGGCLSAAASGRAVAAASDPRHRSAPVRRGAAGGAGGVPDADVVALRPAGRSRVAGAGGYAMSGGGRVVVVVVGGGGRCQACRSPRRHRTTRGRGRARLRNGALVAAGGAGAATTAGRHRRPVRATPTAGAEATRVKPVVCVLDRLRVGSRNPSAQSTSQCPVCARCELAATRPRRANRPAACCGPAGGPPRRSTPARRDTDTPGRWRECVRHATALRK
eukprot:ctg_1028.g422